MKRLLIASVLLAAAANTAWAADTFVIGVIAPTTGPIATVGARQLQTLQWWRDRVNKASPEKAVTCARDLINQGAGILVNFSVTGPIRATMPLVANGPVMLTPSPNIVPEATTYVFQVSPSDLEQTRTLAEYLKSNDIKTLAMIAATDSSGEVGVTSARNVFPKAGIKLNLARIDLKANDASIQLSKVTSADVKVIYSSYSGGGAAAVIKSYANLGLTQPIVVSYANISDSFITLIKNDMPPRLLGLGLRSIDPALGADQAEKKRAADFAAAYKATTGSVIDQLNLTGKLTADTIEAVLTNVQNPKDAKAVKQYLETHTIPSVQTIKFSPDNHVGIGADGAVILEYKSGHWVGAGPIK
jgi:branched-chain amino acid transport system substrate-binding protein